MKKIKFYDALVLLLIIYMYSTFFYKLLPIVNSILGVLFIFIVFCIYLSDLRKRDLLIIFPIIYYIFISLINGDNFDYFFEHTIHLVSTILFIWKLTSIDITEKLYLSMKKYKKPMQFSLIIISLINMILLISKKFMIINTGTLVFSGLSNGSHTIASISCLAIIILIVLNTNQKMSKLSLISLIMYILIIFESGSRIYLLVLISMLYTFYIEKIKTIKHYKLYTLLLIMIISFAIYDSNMIDRFISTANNKYISENKLESFSSGRLIWWKYDINDFKTLNLTNKIFGKGNHYVFELNYRSYGLNIWAHNDFIQILISYGLIGLLFYLIIFGRALLNFYDKKNILYSLVIFLTMIGIATLNGFYTQQHMVFCILLMISLQKNGISKKLIQKEYSYRKEGKEN